METWLPSLQSPESTDLYLAELSPSPQLFLEQNNFPESIFNVHGPVSPDSQNMMDLINTLENLNVINYCQTNLPIHQSLDNANWFIREPSFRFLPIYDETTYLQSAFDVGTPFCFDPQNCVSGIHTLSCVFNQPQTISSIPIQGNNAFHRENGVCLVNFNNQMSQAIDHCQKKRKHGASGKKSYPSKGRWTEDEDRCLIQLVEKYGENNWSQIAASMTSRAGKQCRERWYNHLHPDIKTEPWTEEEEATLVELHREHGNKWTFLSKFMPGRPENMIKNHWNATRRKKRRVGSASSVLADYIATYDPSSSRDQVEELTYVPQDPVVDQVAPRAQDDSLELVNPKKASDVSWLLDNQNFSEFDNSLNALLAEIEANSNCAV